MLIQMHTVLHTHTSRWHMFMSTHMDTLEPLPIRMAASRSLRASATAEVSAGVEEDIFRVVEWEAPAGRGGGGGPGGGGAAWAPHRGGGGRAKPPAICPRGIGPPGGEANAVWAEGMSGAGGGGGGPVLA